MIVDKITVGFVIQQFDTEKQKFVSQEFVAGDEVDYEVDGKSIYHQSVMPQPEPYLPFEMVQPSEGE